MQKISSTEAARLLGVSIENLRILEKQGIVRSALTDAEGRNLYVLEEITQIKSRHSPSLSEEAALVGVEIQRGMHTSVLSLLKFRRSSLLLGTAVLSFFLLSTLIITALFYMYPLATSNFFGYFYRTNVAGRVQGASTTNERGKVLAATIGFDGQPTETSVFADAMKPIAQTSLLLIKAVDGQRYQDIAANPPGVGQTGLTGDQGFLGIPGSQGVVGLAGPQGPEGPQGIAGIQGIQGIAGLTGPAGSQGIQGIAGPAGSTGSAGSTGASGANGTNGTNGAAGTNGIDGIDGTNGTNGTNGTSVADVMTTIGDIIIRDAGNVTARLGIGTSGQVLTVASGVPSWENPVVGSTSFSALTSGTNTIASMLIGSGASLDFTGSGTINASSLNGKTFADPGPIGSFTPSTGAFTDLSSTGALTILGAYATPKGTDYSTTGTQDNVSLGTGSLFRFTGGSPATFTGLLGGTDGRIIRIMNASSSNLFLNNQDAGSLAANRFISANGNTATIPPNGSVSLQYDSGASRWRMTSLPIETSALTQGGNAFGAGLVLGTTDPFDLNLMTNGTTRFSIDAALATLTGNGATTLTSNSTLALTSAAASGLTVNSGTTGGLTLDSGTTGAVNLGTGSNAKAITIGNTTGVTGVTIQSGLAGISFGGDTAVTGSHTFSTGTGMTTLGGDLTVSGDDLFMATNTVGALLVADGTNFNPVVMSGDATINGAGTVTLNYAGGQSASGTLKGFLTAADWNMFNGKQDALGFTPEDVANKSTNTNLGTSNTFYPTQNAVKTYVDNIATGLIWQNPVESVSVIADTSTPVGSPVNNDAYIINTGGDTGVWAAFAPGDLVQYQTATWVKVKSLVIGDRFGVAFRSATTPSGSMTGFKNNLVEVTGGTPGAFTYTFIAPVNNYAVFDHDVDSFYYGVSFTYTTSLGEWVALSASSSFVFDSGLTTLGTHVSLGPLTEDWSQTGIFDINTAGDVSLNGGDLRTTASTATLFNTDATTVNIGGTATTIGLGAAGATVTGGGALTIHSGTATALTLDSGTTGTLNLGTGDDAKTLNIGTGTAGNVMNIGTDNTTADTIFIGSALDSFSLSSTGLTISTLGALTGVTSVDAPGTALNLGTSTATSVSLGKTGITTTNNGALSSSQLLTALNGFTLTTGALNLSASSGTLTLSGLSASSINTGANSLTVTSSNFNTTATGVNSTPIGATTASTGKFTSLTSTGTTDLANIGASNVTIATTGTGTVAIGNATGTFSLISSGGLNVTTGGALTGVASLDTIGASATGLTFAGAGTIASTTTNAMTVDSGTTGDVNLGTGSNAKTVAIGNTTGATAVNVNAGTGNVNFTVGPTSSSGKVQIGNSGTATPDLLVLDNGTADPTGVAGGMYYNTTTTKFRCFQNGAWANCIGGDRIVVPKTTDQSVTSSTTLTSDTALTFAVGSGETWVYNFFLYVRNTNSAAPDFKAALLGASGWTCSAQMSGSEAAGGAFPQAVTTDCDDVPTAMVNSAIGADASNGFNVRIQGLVTTTSAGSFTLQFAQNTSSANSITMKGGSYVQAFKVGGADLAEAYSSHDSSIAPGDVVSVDGTLENGVQKSQRPYDATVLGIVSTKPGMVLGDTVGVGVPVLVALSGRVPVKVSGENGSILAGDYLTSSSTPGVAMKATRSGAMIGTAMTAFDGEGVGQVMVFVKNGSSVMTNANEESGRNILTQWLNESGSTLDTMPPISQVEGVATDSAQVVRTENLIETKILHLISKALSDMFKNIVEFFGKVIFHNDVHFLGRASFNSDTGGFAVINADALEVSVLFDTEYDHLPIVIGSPDTPVVYAITDLSTKGFTIRLHQPEKHEVRFSWTATAITDAKTFVGAAPTATPTTLVSPIGSLPPTPTPEQSAPPVATAEPTISPIVIDATPSAIIVAPSATPTADPVASSSASP